MSRDLRIRGDDYAGRSHIARGATHESNVIQLAGAIPSAFASGRMVSEQENDHASIYRASMQTGNNLSPGLFASVVAMVLRRRKTSHSFSSRAALKLAQFANTVFNISAGLFIAAFVILLFASPFVALGCLLFV